MIVELAASSIDVELVFFVEVHDFKTFAQVRSDIILHILKRFAELKISLAYPTQTSYTAAPDGTLIMPYAPSEPDTPRRSEPRAVSTRG